MTIEHVDRKTLLAEFIRTVWSEGNVDECDRYLADRYTIHHDPGDPWDGKQLDVAGFKERARLSRAPFPDQRFDVQEMFADGDAVVATWLWSATHTGDYPGFPATQRPISMSGATVYYFDAQDRIRGHWQITDRLAIFRQLQRDRGSTQQRSS
jgi:steroid delta-isomerase-like uncharacterized protein